MALWKVLPQTSNRKVTYQIKKRQIVNIYIDKVMMSLNFTSTALNKLIGYEELSVQQNYVAKSETKNNALVGQKCVR